MSGLTTVRDAAVAMLTTTLSQVGRVEAFSGALSFSAANLKNLPREAVFVAALEARNVGPSLDFDLLGSFGVFVLTRGRPGSEERERDGLGVAESVAVALHGATFGLDDVGPARVLEIAPLTDESFEGKGICVWTVVWQQPFVL